MGKFNAFMNGRKIEIIMKLIKFNQRIKMRFLKKTSIVFSAIVKITMFKD
ncbi:hypothetical protein [Zobellia sp. 1_MG-2023]|nr:hypothetical protein [Zobellia sp. 1_MG-2023]MDO6818907.1 hypothetical protein [Zobellia sp. 1_MG-2023]